MARKRKDIGKTDRKEAIEKSPPQMRRIDKPGTSRGLPKGKPSDSKTEKEKDQRWADERYKMLRQAQAYRSGKRR